MKILRNVLIFVAIFAVLGTAYYFISVYEPTKPESTKTIEQKEIFKADKNDIEKIELNNSEGQYTFYKTDGGWVVLGREFIELNQSKVDSLAYSVSSLAAESEIEGNPSDLSVYGLSQPTASIAITLKGGVTKSFYLGDKTPAKTGYYFKTADENTVYTIYTGAGDSLIQNLNTYRIMTITSFDANSVREVAIEKSDRSLKVVYNPPSAEVQQQGYGMISSWLVTSPITRNADNSMITEKLITPLTGISADGIVADNPSDLSAYGIGSTAVTVKTEDKTISFRVGLKEGTTYVYVEGKSPVYTVAASKLSFMDVTAFDLIEKFVHLVNIDLVQSVEINIPNASGTISKEGTGDGASYYAGDVNASEEAYKSMYQKVIGLTADGIMPQPAPKTDLQGTVLYRLTDGSTINLEFYNYDSLNYSVYENGENLFYMKKSKLNDMGAALTKFLKDPRQKVN